MVKRILDGLLDQTNRLGRGQLVLGLPLKLRIADKNRQHDAGIAQKVLGRNLRHLFDIGHFAVFLQTANQCRAKTQFVRAAVGRNDRIAVGIAETVFIFGPGYRPFDPPLVVRQFGISGKGHTVDGRTSADLII